MVVNQLIVVHFKGLLDKIDEEARQVWLIIILRIIRDILALLTLLTRPRGALQKEWQMPPQHRVKLLLTNSIISQTPLKFIRILPRCQVVN